MESDDQSLRRPVLGGPQREAEALHRRQAATGLAIGAANRPGLRVPANTDNVRFNKVPMAFTKGLAHDKFGIVDTTHYERFVEALTQSQGGSYPDIAFDVPTAQSASGSAAAISCTPKGAPGESFGYRKWESPLAGAYFSIEGPDSDGVAMAPAPRYGEDELTAEMAEVYAMALVRDMSFDDLADPSTILTHGGGTIAYTKSDGTPATVGDLVAALNDLAWFGAGSPIGGADPENPSTTLTMQETRRRLARGDAGPTLSAASLFRGSVPGAKDGGYISQFLTLGTGDGLADGIVRFGAQRVDQKVRNARPGVEYMTSWAEWRDVQQGLRLNGTDLIEDTPTAMTTPRHLATYVHFDQLYQAYFNACLILLENGYPTDAGFPTNGHPTRGAFAVFGGPHILSLVTEVASRALKAVRRQKFQIHRRARPERMAAMLTLAANGLGDELGNAEQTSNDILRQLGVKGAKQSDPVAELMRWVQQLNAAQNDPGIRALRGYDCTEVDIPKKLDPARDDSVRNLLLPMAFPEGSPMHPAYGAGHATVAGACVTILKAFFEMFDATPDPADPAATVLRGMDAVGGDPTLTVEGELNKLAANIAIGRNFAGVHYYTDYYDSMRMGERVAVGILQEQMLNYSEPVSMTFRGFDGELIEIATDGGKTSGAVSISIDGDDGEMAVGRWWTKNVDEFVDPALDQADNLAVPTAAE